MRLRFLPMLVLAAAVGMTALVPRARAQDVEQPIIELFDPLITRNPTPERELEINVEYEKRYTPR